MKEPRQRKIALALALAFAVSHLPLPVLAAPPSDSLAAPASAPLEFDAGSSKSRVELEGRDSVRGPSPLQVPGPLEGEFWLTSRGPGLETQRGRVKIELTPTGARLGSFGAAPFRDRLLQNLLYPGYAQLRFGEKGKAFALAAAATAGVGFTIWAQSELWEAEDDAESARAAFAESGVSEEERTARGRRLRDALEQEVFASDRRDRLMFATGAVWGLGILDGLLFAPEFPVTRVAPQRLMLRPSSRSRLAAGVRSAAFPGIGQHYNGQPVKAALTAAGGAAALVYLLHERNDYDAAAKDFRQSRRHLANAENEEALAQAEAAKKAAEEELDDADRDRTLALGVTLGVWGVSILDAVLGAREGSGASRTRFSLSLDPSRRAAAAELRF